MQNKTTTEQARPFPEPWEFHIDRQSGKGGSVNALLQAIATPRPEVDPYQWLRDVAAGKMVQDHLSDLCVDIVKELEREIVSRETAWHDCSLSDVVEQIVREHYQAAEAERGEA